MSIPFTGDQHNKDDGHLKQVELQKMPNTPLGMKIRYEEDRGVYISEVEPGGIAASKGLQVYDEVLEINGHSLRNRTVGEASNLLRASDSIRIQFKRFACNANAPPPPPLPLPSPAPMPIFAPSSPNTSAICASPTNHAMTARPAGLQRRMSAISLRPGVENSDLPTLLLVPRAVLLKKENGSFGLMIKLDPPSGLVYVKELAPDGAAERTGLLAVGDWILDVDGQTMRGLAREAITEVLKGKEEVRLMVARGSDTIKLFPSVPRTDDGPKMLARASSANALGTRRLLGMGLDAPAPGGSPLHFPRAATTTVDSAATPAQPERRLASTRPSMPFPPASACGAAAVVPATPAPTVPPFARDDHGPVAATPAPASTAYSALSAITEVNSALVSPAAPPPAAAPTSTISPALALLQRLHVRTVRLTRDTAQADELGFLSVGDVVLAITIDGTPQPALSRGDLRSAIEAGRDVCVVVTQLK